MNHLTGVSSSSGPVLFASPSSAAIPASVRVGRPFEISSLKKRGTKLMQIIFSQPVKHSKLPSLQHEVWQYSLFALLFTLCSCFSLHLFNFLLVFGGLAEFLIDNGFCHRFPNFPTFHFFLNVKWSNTLWRDEIQLFQINQQA